MKVVPPGLGSKTIVVTQSMHTMPPTAMTVASPSGN